MAEFTSFAARGKSKKCANRLVLGPTRVCATTNPAVGFVGGFLCYFLFR